MSDGSLSETTPTSGLVVLSHRGPQRYRDRWVRSSGGLVTALDPVLRQQGGVWVSAAEGEDDPEPPDIGYRQVLVRLADQAHSGFYGEVSNGVLWPTLHGFPTIAEIADAPWGDYEKANRAFADAAVGAAGDDDLVWVHDYHLMLAPRLLRDRRPDLRIGWFNHVPWPDADHFAVLPWRREILKGLLGADVLGFHTAAYASHFLECAEHLGDVDIDREHGLIETADHNTRVVVAPIGIPTRTIAERVESDAVRTREAVVRDAVQGRRIILGVDRLDYTKGIPERLHAYARLLEKRPELNDEIVLVQIVVPSRESVPAYARLKEEIDRQVGQLNGAFGKTGQVAVHYRYGSLDPIDLYAHYRAADVALVTPLRDGMNLVAQEYVASQTASGGALVLSEFAGAAERLREAYIVNPHDIDAVADQLDRALHAPQADRERRMRALRATVDSLDVELWANKFLQLLKVGPRPLPGGTAGEPFGLSAQPGGLGSTVWS